jgi:hypothetical protein
MTDPFRAALDALPEGASEGLYRGRRWQIARSRHAGGRSVKLQAWELGGTGYISLNHYRLAAGDRLRPCEMPERQVRDFVLGVRVLPQP